MSDLQLPLGRSVIAENGDRKLGQQCETIIWEGTATHSFGDGDGAMAISGRDVTGPMMSLAVSRAGGRSHRGQGEVWLVGGEPRSRSGCAAARMCQRV